MATIKKIDENSTASIAGMTVGEQLISINGKDISDVLDYRYATTSRKLKVVTDRGIYKIKKDQYEELGLNFGNYLMDEQKRCKNKCIFCFVDQLPKGLRDTLYFKDDDDRMSFLLGNYITLTNLSEKDIKRICKIKISPINISVHTTNPQLRVKMMKNPAAANGYKIMKKFAKSGITMNTQLVMCSGYNDGAELERTLSDLGALYPAVNSVSAVPVGLSKYRDGLAQLTPFTKESAAQLIGVVQKFNKKFATKHGRNLCYPSDEFFLLAGKEIPENDWYDGFPQLENGVGMLRTLEDDFNYHIGKLESGQLSRTVSIVTGQSSYLFIRGLADKVQDKFSGLKVNVYKIKNDFFGEQITVTGLIVGCDIEKQLAGKNLGECVIISGDMLRWERDLFLDSMSVTELETKLKTKIMYNNNDGEKLLSDIIGEVTKWQNQ